ncbi:MAG TPA: hypothetical protein VFI25_12330 [Planctomycetota bacterium]|nr:hypothetical protein [Planctomycetota bacterium]
MRKFRWTLYALLVLPPGLGATARPQEGPDFSPSTLEVRSFRPPRDRVSLDRPGDGNIWARGRTYKARFGADGAEYIPFLGPTAPQNYPLGLTFRSASVGGHPLATVASKPPSLEGFRVTYDRGVLGEVYELAPDSVEQLFRLSSAPPEAGDLAVRLEISGGLAFAGPEDAGLRFEAPQGLGGVRYGRASVLDAAGSRAAVPTSFEAGTIEIRVPGELLAGAAFPLTIDPILTTFPVDDTAFDDYAPDVSFDATVRIWACVYEETFSAVDHDVFWTKVDDDTGAVTFVSYVDSTGAYWGHPRIANNNLADGFLVVAHVMPFFGADFDIRGREIDATTSLFEPAGQFDIEATADDEAVPDVGGDAYPIGPTVYLVAWEYDDAGTHEIRCTTVTHDPMAPVVAASQDVSIFGDAVEDVAPAVSNSDGVTGLWGIVWVRDVMAGDITLRTVRYDGFLGARDPVESTADLDGAPDVACNDPAGGSGVEFLVVWERGAAGFRDIMGRRVDSTLAANNPLGAASTDLSALEVFSGLVLAWDQFRPTVDANGCGYGYVYAEAFPGFGVDVRGASAYGDAAPSVGEGYVLLAHAATDEDRPRIASRWSSSYDAADTARTMAVWQDFVDPAAPDHDIEGALYAPGNVAVVNVGCGAAEPTISYSGSPSLGAEFTVTVLPAGSFVLIGPPAVFAVFCAACPIVFPIFVGPLPSPFDITIPCEPSLAGGTVGIQGVEISFAALAGGCVAGAVWFRATDLLVVTLG